MQQNAMTCDQLNGGGGGANDHTPDSGDDTVGGRWWFGLTLVPNEFGDRDLFVVTALWGGRAGDIVALLVGMTTMMVKISSISKFFSSPKD